MSSGLANLTQADCAFVKESSVVWQHMQLLEAEQQGYLPQALEIPMP